MKGYRIKHIPTGLYLGPVKGSYRRKTNLSKNGKVYFSKPTNENIKSWFGRTISINETQLNKFNIKAEPCSWNKSLFSVDVDINDFEIEEL